MKTIRMAIVLVGALFISGVALPGTWFGRPSYYRSASTFNGWGE